MDLSVPSYEHTAHLLDALTTKLRMASTLVIKAEEFDMSRYDELYELVTWVLEKPHVSVSEMDAIVRALGALRAQ
ncbi:MAG: DUF1128 family protein [Paenibacillaceae bacterium]|jgi:uncharacterized protein YfkK (UPF0435 family)|nr:DUF1128 family protein [Paenibacillaceae bacterium]